LGASASSVVWRLRACSESHEESDLTESQAGVEASAVGAAAAVATQKAHFRPFSQDQPDNIFDGVLGMKMHDKRKAYPENEVLDEEANGIRPAAEPGGGLAGRYRQRRFKWS
jgi:hypothetical protein